MAAPLRPSAIRLCAPIYSLRARTTALRLKNCPVPSRTAISTLLVPESSPSSPKASVLSPSQSKTRLYYTASAEKTSPYPPAESAILAAAYTHVPAHGFTTDALLLGLQDEGYPSSALNLFPRGPFELFLYHLTTQRLALTAAFPSPTQPPPTIPTATTIWTTTAQLITHRLHANAAILPHLPAALAQIPQARYLPAALAELGSLASEIVYRSGATDLDVSWYGRRTGVAGVYAASEVFMTQDASIDWGETDAFVARRVEGLQAGGEGLSAVGEWAGFTAGAAVNLARSWGLRV